LWDDFLLRLNLLDLKTKLKIKYLQQQKITSGAKAVRNVHRTEKTDLNIISDHPYIFLASRHYAPGFERENLMNWRKAASISLQAQRRDSWHSHRKQAHMTFQLHAEAH